MFPCPPVPARQLKLGDNVRVVSGPNESQVGRNVSKDKSKKPYKVEGIPQHFKSDQLVLFETPNSGGASSSGLAAKASIPIAPCASRNAEEISGELRTMLGDRTVEEAEKDRKQTLQQQKKKLENDRTQLCNEEKEKDLELIRQKISKKQEQLDSKKEHKEAVVLATTRLTKIRRAQDWIQELLKQKDATAAKLAEAESVKLAAERIVQRIHSVTNVRAMLSQMT